MIRSIPATELQDGMVLALPFNKSATVSAVRVGRRIVMFRTEYGIAKVGIHDEVLIEVETED